MLTYIILAVVVISLSSGEVNVLKWDQKDVKLDPNTGHLDNCGIAKNFSIIWHPKNLLPRGKVDLSAQFIAPYDISEGVGSAEVYVKGFPKSPIIKVSQKGTCADIKKLGLHLQCPVKAGQLVKGAYENPKLPALPSGSYVLKLEIRNSKNQQFLCATGEVDIHP